MSTFTGTVKPNAPEFNVRKRGTRAHITERDGIILAFLAKFPGATTEAVSMLTQPAQTTIPNRPTNGLSSIETTRARLDKLRRLGVVEDARSPFETGVKWFGITERGVEAATFYEYDTRGARGIGGLSLSRMNHYAAVALTAAAIASPLENPIQKAAGGRADIDSLASENLMREAYESERRAQQKAIEEGATDAKTWAEWRMKMLTEAREDIRNGYLDMADMVAEAPALLTVGGEEKTIVQPDLAVLRDAAEGRGGTSGSSAKNVLVEVERTRKPGGLEDYKKRLQTLNAEISTHAVYSRVLYVVGSNSIGNVIKKADAEVGLIPAGRLVIVPLTGREGRKNPVKPARIPTHSNPHEKPAFVLPDPE